MASLRRHVPAGNMAPPPPPPNIPDLAPPPPQYSKPSYTYEVYEKQLYCLELLLTLDCRSCLFETYNMYMRTLVFNNFHVNFSDIKYTETNLT